MNEVALMIGLQATISLHVDVDRQVIRLQCGDFLRYFDEAVEFSRSTFIAPPPHDADVVISNAYPCDLTLEAVRMKGLLPLRSAGPMASKIAIASCVGGLGLHNVYPAYNVPRYQRLRHLTRRIRTFGWKTTGMSIAARVTAPIIRRFAGLSGQDLREGKASSPLCHPIHLYRPSFGSVPIPDRLPGIEVRTSWQEIVRIVGLEQNDRNRLRVVVYPCAFLQVPGPLPADHTIPAEPSGAIEDSSS